MQINGVDHYTKKTRRPEKKFECTQVAPQG